MEGKISITRLRVLENANIKEKISLLKEKRDTILSELDTQIKVSNATTFIEI